MLRKRSILSCVVLVLTSFTGALASIGAEIPKPRIWYDFETVRDDCVVDRSGNEYDGRLFGAQVSEAGGKIGSGFYSSASTPGWIELPTEALLGATDMTVTVWVNLDEIGAYARIFDFGGGTKRNLYLTPSTSGDSDGRMQLAVTRDSTQGEYKIARVTQFQERVWTHVAALQHGNSFELYLNGRLVASLGGVELNLTNALVGDIHCYLGKSQYKHDQLLYGKIDDFRFYDVALTPEQVVEVMCECAEESERPSAAQTLVSESIDDVSHIKKGSMIEDENVNLLPGLFKQMRDDNEVNLLQMDVNRLCAAHFIAAGKAPKAERYGGWESWKDCGFGVGHWLSAACLMYKKTGNKEYLEKIDQIVTELAQTQRPSGFIGGISEERFIENVFEQPQTFKVNEADLGGIWDCWYGIQKVYKGLIETYQLTGDQRALDLAVGFAKWSKRWTDKLTYAQTQRMLIAEHGGMGETSLWLYRITGDKDAFELAKRFLREELLETLAAGEDNLTGRHVNEHIPEIQNAATYYEFTGEQKYRRASENFWRFCREDRCYANSGHGRAEHFPKRNEEPLDFCNTETCCAFNMLKLTETLYSWEHKPEYIDYIEDALFNQIYPSQDQDNHEGYGKTYFVSFVPGSYRVFSTRDDSFWCCYLSGMENPARLDKMIYYKDGDLFYVNLFVPSTVRWAEKGLAFKQETNFPYSAVSTLTVTDGDAQGALKIRSPYWVDGTLEVKVNGEVVSQDAQDGYVTLTRRWRKGDVVQWTAPTSLRTYRARNGQIAFKYGPILLAAVYGDAPEKERYTTNIAALSGFKGLETPEIKGSPERPDAFLKPVEPARLVFEINGEHTSDGSTLTFRPFYELNRQRYVVYWNVGNSK